MRLFFTLWPVFWLVSATAAMRILSPSALRCRRQDLNCTASHSNCMDPGWLKVNTYTPAAPEDLQVRVETRRDDAGLLQPVLLASWGLRDDGSIRYLKGTELHVLMRSTNQNLCIRYSFKETLLPRDQSDQKWSFSSEALVLDPGSTYRVSVFNIPKPEVGHSQYDVSTRVDVPNCRHPSMQLTQFCVERGSLWEPNITMTTTGRSLTISFRPDQLCDEYLVLVRGSADQQHVHVSQFQDNQTTLNATFSLAKWPRSSCQFDAEIKPFFQQCNSDCPRRRATFDICGSTLLPDAAPYVESVCIFAGVGLVFTCAVMAVSMYFLCRRKAQVSYPPSEKDLAVKRKQPLQQPPKVLVIYSQDHHLYRDVVLKLCAFLQAKCGTKVLVDLLDSTSVGMVGRVRWLEWQRQQLKNPSDKILVLCSRGVQAKWRAMCGQGKVMLKEDVLSPTDDMLTPFLNLFLPELHQAARLGKYMVAYFDDISSETDVPSVFDIAVKFSLMKHFEELFFRLLDVEKYEPGHVLHIEGISGEEYFHCASGLALRNAIEAFRAHQLEHPDWFEKECVVSDEDVGSEAEQLIEQMQIPPVLECVLPIREGPPVYVHEVEVNENCNSVHVLTPQLNPELSSVAEHLPVLHPAHSHPSNSVQVLAGHLVYPRGPSPGSVFIAEPVLNNQPPPRQNQQPTEEDESAPLLPSGQPVARYPLLNSLDSRPPEPPSELSLSEPVEMDEEEILESSPKGPSSGSDQGYISEESSQHDAAFKEGPLAALARMQEELFQRTLGASDLV
ncbi:interleukin 17 receptor A1a [Cololabis saira]|uniref:interleukin 17 receptor A1a n=1 Tax=Cololabis saira TaxID=129043 RepID=UPI002AD5A163|nr:interleukin 17 receptor A1a [Cololabis saira]